jgi:hypothetical protein
MVQESILFQTIQFAAINNANLKKLTFSTTAGPANF